MILPSLMRMNERLVVLSFFLIISFGNLFRFFAFYEHWNNFLLTEGLLYFSCIISSVFLMPSRDFLKKLFLFFGVVFLSLLYGSWTYGWDNTAVLYSLRLVLLIYSAKIVGSVFLRKFEGAVVPFFSWLLKGYIVALFSSFAIYLIFPRADLLWHFLSECNIRFYGDPHCNRLVSVYFDPNFYGAIACIPFLLSVFLFSSTKRMHYLLFSLLIAASIFLTQSRSGITLFCVLLGWMGALYWKSSHVICKGSKKQFILVLGMFFFGLGVLISQGFFTVFLKRIVEINYDPSAGLRFVAWKEGFEVLKEFPLLGIGYNFIHQKSLWVDSSLLLACITLGICTTLCLIAYSCVLLRGLYLQYRNTQLQKLVSHFIFYISSSVFFYSFFNNLVFYLFWALPVLVIYHFLTQSKQYEEIL